VITVFTIGHSSLSIGAFVGILRAHHLERVVDVRSWPASRRHPHFTREPLERSLHDAGVDYHWEKDLGGRRRPGRGPSAHTAIAEPMFRAYVDHLNSREASEAIQRLLDVSRTTLTAVMCAERDPARCHRSFLADRLVALRLASVVHVLDERNAELHVLPEGLLVRGESLVYADAQQSLIS
jgi:uncharacterized protein (DUF488 family)